MSTTKQSPNQSLLGTRICVFERLPEYFKCAQCVMCLFNIQSVTSDQEPNYPTDGVGLEEKTANEWCGTEITLSLID